MKKLFFFIANFPNSYETSTTTQNFKTLVFLLLKLRRLTYDAKFENNRFFIGLLAERTTNT